MAFTGKSGKILKTMAKLPKGLGGGGVLGGKRSGSVWEKGKHRKSPESGKGQGEGKSRKENMRKRKKKEKKEGKTNVPGALAEGNKKLAGTGALTRAGKRNRFGAEGNLKLKFPKQSQRKNRAAESGRYTT